MNAILWLIQNNPFYKSVQVDHVALQALPDDGIPGDLLTIDDPNDSLGDNDPPHKDQAAGNAQLQHDHVNANEFADQVSSFIPLPQRKPQEEAAIRSAIKEQDPLDWPVNTGDPINEFQTSGLASMAFPTLFPYGRADPTNKGRERCFSYRRFQASHEVCRSDTRPEIALAFCISSKVSLLGSEYETAASDSVPGKHLPSAKSWRC